MATDLYSTRIKTYGTDVVGKAGEAITAGFVVYASGVDNNLPVYTKALANSAIKVAGVLYYLVGRMAGGNAANGDLIRIASAQHVTGLAGSPAVGDPVFVSDTGAVALTAGTVVRKIGTVFYSSGGVYGFTFDGVSGIAAATPGGTPNKLTKFDSTGSLASSNITEDPSSFLAIFGRGLRIDDGPLVLDGNEQIMTGGGSYNVPDTTASLELRWDGAGGPAGRTVNLPATPVTGRVICFMDADGTAAANNVTIVGKSGGVGLQIESADTMLMTANWAAGMLVALRDRWKVLASRQI